MENAAKMKICTRNPAPKTRNRLIQIIRMGKSTGQKWVKLTAVQVFWHLVIYKNKFCFNKVMLGILKYLCSPGFSG